MQRNVGDLHGLVRPTDLVSVREAAIIAKLHPDSIWRMARKGRLTIFGRRGYYRISLGELLPQRDMSGHGKSTEKPTSRTR